MDVNEMFSVILKEVRQSRRETNERLDKLENRMDNLEIRMDNLENRMDNLEIRMESLENKVDSLEIRVGSLENRVSDLQRETRANTQIVQNFKWDIDLLTDKQAKSELSINRLEKRIET